ncbi:MAG TPA: hypothetical protein VEN29_10630 [Casimicrobiaceae bacterium]|nr:hypothetical protein [Casimicrobiaceae bacterium]
MSQRLRPGLAVEVPAGHRCSPPEAAPGRVVAASRQRGSGPERLCEALTLLPVNGADAIAVVDNRRHRRRADDGADPGGDQLARW